METEYDAIYQVVRGENRAVALRVIERETNRMLKRADIDKVVYSIVKRGQTSSIQITSPPVVPIEGHTNVEIPVDECIRDNPPIDPIDEVQYNFVFIIPCEDADGNDISPFTEVDTFYDMSIRFFPVIGGRRFVAVRTVRIECI